MENHAEHPAGESEVPKRQVVLAQWVASGYLFSDFGDSVIVGEEVEETEEYRRGLLNAHEAVEGPFAVELLDRLKVWLLARETLIGDYVLAGVVAFGRAVPQ